MTLIEAAADKRLIELQARFDALYELAVQANQNCRVVAGYFAHHRPGLAGSVVDWCDNIDIELEKVLNED